MHKEENDENSDDHSITINEDLIEKSIKLLPIKKYLIFKINILNINKDK